MKQVVFALALSMLLTSMAQAQMGPPKDELVDSTGKLVRKIKSYENWTNEGAWISFQQKKPPNWATFTLFFARDYIAGNQEIWYENPDCEGNKGIMIDSHENMLTHAVAIAPPGKTVYVSNRHKPPFDMNPQSFYTYDGLCINDPITGPITFLPVEAVEDIEGKWMPPFHVR